MSRPFHTTIADTLQENTEDLILSQWRSTCQAYAYVACICRRRPPRNRLTSGTVLHRISVNVK